MGTFISGMIVGIIATLAFLAFIGVIYIDDGEEHDDE